MKIDKETAEVISAAILSALVLEQTLKNSKVSDAEKISRSHALCQILRKLGLYLVGSGQMPETSLTDTFSRMKAFAEKHEEPMNMALGLVEKCDDLLDMGLSEHEKMVLVHRVFQEQGETDDE